MIALVLLIVLWAIAAGVGRVVLNFLSNPVALRDSGTVPALLERFVFASALGLGIAAYGVYALGLCGALSIWPITMWWLTLMVLGARGMISNVIDLRHWLARRRRGQSEAFVGSKGNVDGDIDRNIDRNIDRDVLEEKPDVASSSARTVLIASRIALLILGLISLCACFRPPGPIEWDVISYHLADPKLFLMQHRIVSLPTEHHSNFPFTMEMLFTVGLLYNGFALANLFHWTMAVLTTLALLAFGSRIAHPLAGHIAAVVFASTPLVLWESSVAYIDLGLALYTTPGRIRGGAVLYTEREEGITDSARPSRWDISTSACLLAGAMTGFALGMKYLALIPFTLLGFMLLWQRLSWHKLAVYLGVALVVGSPWYIKNVLVTANPVYPFAYRIFPHSRYWSADRATAYQSEQDKFGSKPFSKDARSKLLNVLQIPWHLLVNANTYYNPGEFNFTALVGGVYAALIFPLAFVRRIPPGIRGALFLAGGQLLAWFFLSQVGRYIIQMLPLLALAAGYSACRWAFPGEAETENGAADRFNRRFGKMVGVAGLTVVAGHVGYVLLAISTLPMNADGRELLAMRQLGELPSSVSVPTLLADLGHPEIWHEDLRRYFDVYAAEEWINQHAAPNVGVALYDEVRGYYLDRPYVWANRQHSSYVPYETMHTAADLTHWMQQHNIGYALINLTQDPHNDPARRAALSPEDPLRNGPNRVESLALQRWYVDETETATDPARILIGEAVKQGLWAPVDAEHGCVVLRIGGGVP